MAVKFERECFFIAPIGEKGSDVRKRSDGVRDFVVGPAAEVHGLQTRRADDVGEPGQITSQAVEHCLKAKAAVADLTGGNPNVYYELSIRHGAQLPVVLIAEQGTVLPFDLGQSRAIFFDHTDLSDAGRARAELETQIRASLIGTPDNPIANGMRLAQLDSGSTEERTLARMVARIERLAGTVDKLSEQLNDEKPEADPRPPVPKADTPLAVRRLLEEGKRRPRNGIRTEEVRNLEETEPVPIRPDAHGA
jgi:hypothetical protein